MLQNGIGVSSSVKNKRLDGAGLDSLERGADSGFGLYHGNDLHNSTSS